MSSLSVIKPCAKQTARVFGRQHDNQMLQIGGRLGTQTHDDVKDRALRAAHILRFGRRRILEVQAAKVPRFALKLTLACATIDLNPCAENSSAQNMRAT